MPRSPQQLEQLSPEGRTYDLLRNAGMPHRVALHMAATGTPSPQRLAEVETILILDRVWPATYPTTIYLREES